MTGAMCGNANNPRGPWHETTPPATRWQWGKRLSQWLNRERWGCRCDKRRGGEESGDQVLGLVREAVTDGQQVLGTCSPERYGNLKAALRELFTPPRELDEDERQSVDEQTRVRTAVIRRLAHPDTCDGTDNCGCAS